MKTQLIQDFSESGSAPGAPSAEPLTQPRPAVWHRPEPAHGFAPQPPGFADGQGETTVPDLAAPLNARRSGVPRETTDVNSDPEWLAALLARDAAELSESQSSGRWMRRLFFWGTATVVPVLLAAGGLWLYQENRVEGALVVVANTSPAPVSSGMAMARAPAMPVTPVTPITPVAETKDVLPSSAEPDQPVQEAEPIPAPEPRRTPVRKRPKAEARAAIPANGEPSARQRKEETLMQCRAHGYDDRQCLERGCEMTRFGFACKG